MYRFIEPEVAGGLGKETVLDNKTHPPVIRKLNYEFGGWMGDDILESFPCFIVTERLKTKISEEKLSGIIFDDVLVTASQEFKLLHPNIILPKFHWAKINGMPGLDDFAIAEDFRMVISEKTYRVLTLFNVNQAIFEEVKKN
jgi:hypothetical protein